MPGPYTAFAGPRRLASGALPRVAKAVKSRAEAGEDAPLLVFHDETGRVVDLWKDHEPPPPPAEPRGPGRPKLGVTAREITLLPQQWEWLSRQPGGASVAIRRLVEDARKTTSRADRVRRSQEVAYRFMTTMAGNLPGYEEALRALFKGEKERFDEETASWPDDVRRYAAKLAAGAFSRRRKKS